MHLDPLPHLSGVVVIAVATGRMNVTERTAVIELNVSPDRVPLLLVDRDRHAAPSRLRSRESGIPFPRAGTLETWTGGRERGAGGCRHRIAPEL